MFSGRVDYENSRMRGGVGPAGAFHSHRRTNPRRHPGTGLDRSDCAAGVLTDKAYDADALLECLDAKQAKAVILAKANRKEQRACDKHQYRNRNVVERLFAKLKQSRRVTTRYDKLASRFESFVEIAASMRWLR